VKYQQMKHQATSLTLSVWQVYKRKKEIKK